MNNASSERLNGRGPHHVQVRLVCSNTKGLLTRRFFTGHIPENERSGSCIAELKKTILECTMKWHTVQPQL